MGRATRCRPFFCDRFGKNKQHPTLVTSANEKGGTRRQLFCLWLSATFQENVGHATDSRMQLTTHRGHTDGSLLTVSAEKLQATETLDRWLEVLQLLESKLKGGWSRRFSPHATREVGRARDQSINTARNVGAVLRKWLLKPCEKQGIGRGEHRCIVRQMHNARNLTATGSKCGYSLGLGSLHRIQVSAFKTPHPGGS